MSRQLVRTPPPQGYVRDGVAAAATLATVAGLCLERETITAVVTYGFTDWLVASVVVPAVRLGYSGTRVNTFEGQSTLQSAQSGTATGLGDVSVSARLRLAGAGASGIAIGTDVRCATGREDDLLGAGQNAYRVLGISSWEHKLVALHGERRRLHIVRGNRCQDERGR